MSIYLSIDSNNLSSPSRMFTFYQLMHIHRLVMIRLVHFFKKKKFIFHTASLAIYLFYQCWVIGMGLKTPLHSRAHTRNLGQAVCTFSQVSPVFLSTLTVDT